MSEIEAARSGTGGKAAIEVGARPLFGRNRAGIHLGSVLASTCVVLLIMIGTLGSYFVPYLPPPTGPFPVGTALWDVNSPVPGLSPSAENRCPLSVQFWYPAEPGTGEGRAPYRSASAGLLSLVRSVRTGAALDAALSSRLTRYPALVSLPGWAGNREENTAFVQDLASRGFVVVGIGYDNPACAGVDAQAGGASAVGMDFSSPDAFEHTLGVARQKIDRVSRAASQVVDALKALDRVDPNNRFNGRIDLDRLGVVGYSLGGAIAMQLCSRDGRFKAAVNIDGWFFDAASEGWLKQPFMMISDDSPSATPSDLADPDPLRRYPSLLDNATDRRLSEEFPRHGGVLVKVLGSSHLDFSDMGYLSHLDLLRGRRPDGAAIHKAADYSAAFFKQAMNGDSSPLFSDPPASVQLQTWERFMARGSAE